MSLGAEAVCLDCVVSVGVSGSALSGGGAVVESCSSMLSSWSVCASTCSSPSMSPSMSSTLTTNTGFTIGLTGVVLDSNTKVVALVVGKIAIRVAPSNQPLV